MYTLVTLDQLRADLDIPLGEDSYDARLIACIEAASLAFEHQAARRFSPHVRTWPHAIPVDRRTLALTDDLLELHELRDGSGVLPADAYTLWPPQPPYSLLTLRDGRAFAGDGSPRPILITGVWGWHERWIDAFPDVGQGVVNNPLNTTDTLLSLTSVAGADAQAEAYFAVGTLIRVGSGQTAEFMRVTRVDFTLNRLTVLRAQNGSIARTHANGTPVRPYRVPREALDVVRAWAAHRFDLAGNTAHGNRAPADPDAPPLRVQPTARLLTRLRV